MNRLGLHLSSRNKVWMPLIISASLPLGLAASAHADPTSATGSNTARFQRVQCGTTSARVVVTITNNDTDKDTFTVRATGGSGAVASPATISVDGGDARTQLITVPKRVHAVYILQDGASVGSIPISCASSTSSSPSTSSPTSTTHSAPSTSTDDDGAPAAPTATSAPRHHHPVAPAPTSGQGSSSDDGSSTKSASTSPDSSSTSSGGSSAASAPAAPPSSSNSADTKPAPVNKGKTSPMRMALGIGIGALAAALAGAAWFNDRRKRRFR